MRLRKFLTARLRPRESLDVLSAAAGNEELQELLTSEESGKDGRDIDFFNKMFTKYADEIKSFIKNRDKGKVLKVNFDREDMGVAAARPSSPKPRKKKKK